MPSAATRRGRRWHAVPPAARARRRPRAPRSARRVLDRQQCDGQPAESLRAPKASPAPTDIRPSGNAAKPIRCIVVATASGKVSPSAFAARPANVLMMSGFLASSLSVEWPPWRASGQTAATLQTGTQSRDQQRHPGQSLRAAETLRQSQSDVRVEAIGDLCARRVPACVDAGPAAERQRQSDADASIASAAIARFAACAGCSGLFTIELKSRTGKSR